MITGVIVVNHGAFVQYTIFQNAMQKCIYQIVFIKLKTLKMHS